MAWFGRAARLLLPYGAVVVSRGLDCLYVLQVERYKPDRFRAWVVSHRRALVPGRECALQALTVAAAVALALAGQYWLGSVIVWLLTGHIIQSRHQSLQVSQRLHWTARVARVTAVALGLGGFLVAWAANAAGHALPASHAASRYVAGAIGGLAFVGGRWRPTLRCDTSDRCNKRGRARRYAG